MRSIILLPVGSADRSIVEALADPLAQTFRARVEIMDYDLDLQPFYDDERVQYNSTDILHHISTNRIATGPPGRGRARPPKILAVLSRDLFIPILTYVFGESELGGRVSVVSYHRLQPERYGLQPDRRLLETRIRKEAVHELGHSFGLIHCLLQECVMHASTYVEDIDIKGDRFCPTCRSELNASR